MDKNIKTWELDEFRQELASRNGADVLEVFDEIYIKLEETKFITWSSSGNRIEKLATFWPWIDSAAFPPLCFRLDGRVEIPFKWMQMLSNAPFDKEENRLQLQIKVQELGVLESESIVGRPTFSMLDLRGGDKVQQVVDLFVWYRSQGIVFRVDEDLQALESEENHLFDFHIVEGKIVERRIKSPERSSINRKRAIEIHGVDCYVCGFNFSKAYGDLGLGFIEVHHIKPLSTFDGAQVVDAKNDLVTVCANCHRMLHRKKDQVVSLDKLKERVAANRDL